MPFPAPSLALGSTFDLGPGVGAAIRGSAPVKSKYRTDASGAPRRLARLGRKGEGLLRSAVTGVTVNTLFAR